jgi:hypothetical protein
VNFLVLELDAFARFACGKRRRRMRYTPPCCVVQCIMCICIVVLYMVWRIEWRSSELAGWRGFAIYTESWRVSRQFEKRLARLRISHASFRIKLYIVHVVVVGRNLKTDQNYCCPCCPEDEGEEAALSPPPIKGTLSSAVGSG